MGKKNGFSTGLTVVFTLASLAAFGLAGLVAFQQGTGRILVPAVASFGGSDLGPVQPEVVAIERFAPERDIAKGGEVQVQGQLDASMQFDLMVPVEGGNDVAVMLPVYPAGATDVTGPAAGILLYRQGLNGPGLGDGEIDTLLAGHIADGTVGPVMDIAGRISDMGAFEATLRETFAENGRLLGDAPVIIAPFRAGRAAVAGPLGPWAQVAALGFAGLVLMNLGMILNARRRNARLRGSGAANGDAPEAVLADQAEEGEASWDDLDPDTDLVRIAAYSPEMADGSSGAQVMREVLALGRRSDETGVYAANRDGIDDFAKMESGGLKRALPGRGVSEKIAGPKAVKQESPLAARQDAEVAADIMAAVRKEVTQQVPVSMKPAADNSDALFARVNAAIGGAS
ncbi:hypothetical protein [Vannielia sp.]|uniref:hypothetical protein n=1 Tax=Vannielia sp. TaxID=2813045 RepID=UPI00262E4F72|nr:hypothetical protein [Vannielia sp.]MDF1872230.1 hypothetical protein [Vannielia sp.]